MENKKSVLLYCDIIHTVEKLDNETAGLLFKHYLRYINDQNPTTDNPMVDIVFEPIKQSLKRDLKKWEIRAERSRKNGSKGGRPKNLEQPKEPTGLIDNPDEPRKPVIDNGKVIGSVNGIVKEREIRKTIPELEEFLEHAKQSCILAKVDYSELEFSIKSKYQTWKDDGWKDGFGNNIRNWRNTFRNTLASLKSIKPTVPVVKQTKVIPFTETPEGKEFIKRQQQG